MPSTPPPGILVDDSACHPDDLSPCGGVTVRTPGGQDWDELVDLAVTSSWPGLEALGGAAGTVAEAVRDNVIRRGQQAADVVASVRTWDRAEDRQRTLAWGDCRFGPGSSRLQETLPDGSLRYDLVEVSWLFKLGDLTAPVRDPELARLLDVEPGERVPLADVRRVLPGPTATQAR